MFFVEVKQLLLWFVMPWRKSSKTDTASSVLLMTCCHSLMVLWGFSSSSSDSKKECKLLPQKGQMWWIILVRSGLRSCLQGAPRLMESSALITMAFLYYARVFYRDLWGALLEVLKDLPVGLISRITLGGEIEFNQRKRARPKEIGIPDVGKRQCGCFQGTAWCHIKENVGG